MSGYYVKLGDTIRIAFGTSNASGAATDADSTPTVTVYEQGTALGYAPTVTNKATGLYEVAIVCSTGNGFEVGKEYSAAVAAVVGAVTGRDGIGSFAIVAAGIDDLATAANLATANTNISTVLGHVDTEVAAIKAKTDNLPDDPADASVVAGLIAAVEAKVDTVDTVADAIQVKTDALPTDPADASVISDALAALASTLATILGHVDTEVGSIKTTVEALPSAAANASALLGATLEGANTVAQVLRLLTGVLAGTVVNFTGSSLVFKSLDGAKTRLTVTVGATGRTAIVVGDLS